MNFSVFIIIGLSFAFLLLIKRLSRAQFVYLKELSSLVLIGIICIELFYGWLIDSKYFFQFPFLLRLNTPLVFLIGPVIYFLIKASLDAGLKWKEVSWLHFLPFFVIILYLLPLYLSPQAEKLLYLKEMYEKLPFDSRLIGGLRRMHQLGYLIVSIVLLRTQATGKLKRKELHALYAIVGAFCIFVLFDIYRYFFSFDLLTGVFDTLLLSAIAIFLVYDQLSNPKESFPSSKKEREDLSAQAKIIRQVLETKQGYLNPKFNLDDLAELCKIPKHLLSQTINQEMAVNFNQLINQYRVEEAIRLLGSPDTKHLTIEAISSDAGFNSVSSFNANFKKQTGKSPKEYR